MITAEERRLIQQIKKQTSIHNVDNISRTKAYQNFYLSYPEVRWAFLASMVSRNAGWNMTDLHMDPFQSMLTTKDKNNLFSTYERANWLIFSDAYPQLLVYALSCQKGQGYFHLLPYFEVSTFMEKEWTFFWNKGDCNRLITALIINEQNVIQKPVIQQYFFKNEVFRKLPFLSQDLLHLSAVLLPTLKGNVYGAYVHGFSHVSKRISLGKKLSALLFHQDYYQEFLAFAKYTEPTGSRFEYERYFTTLMPKGPMLRMVYPIITHQDIIRRDWYYSGWSVRKKWWKDEEADFSKDVSNRFYAKRFMMSAWDRLEKTSTNKK